MRFGMKLRDNVQELTPLQSAYLIHLAVKYADQEEAAVRKAARRRK